MSKIYQRFNPENTPTRQNQPANISHSHRPANQPTIRANGSNHRQSQIRQPGQNHQTPNQQKPSQNPNYQRQHQNSQTPGPKNHGRKGEHQAKGLCGLVGRILPASIYNPDTKRIFGFLTAEDLLLVALIFLFLDSNDEDSNLTVLALAFVLLSDYIDLSAFNL